MHCLMSVKMVAVNHVSNALVPSIREISAVRTLSGLFVWWTVPGLPTGRWTCSNRATLCLFRHKLFGPTGIGVLWGREALLEAMPPFWAEGK